MKFLIFLFYHFAPFSIVKNTTYKKNGVEKLFNFKFQAQGNVDYYQQPSFGKEFPFIFGNLYDAFIATI